VTGKALTLSGSGEANDGALRNISGNNTWTGANIALGTNARINSDAGLLALSSGTITGSGSNLIVGGAGNTTISSTIATGAGTLTKDGNGLLTLSAANTFTGATTISGGTLAISGSLSNASPITMSTRTALALQGGSVKAAGITVPAGAIFSGWGSVSGGVTNNGTYHGRGYLTGTAGTLAVAGGLVVNAGAATFMRVGNSGSDRIDVTGNLTLSGTLGVSLAPGSLIGTFTLFTYTGSLTYSPLTLAGLPAGVTGSIDTATAGSVKLVLSSDDNLLDAWEMARFGNLNQGDAGDPDGDGFNNLAEMIAGSMPTNSASTPLDTDGNGIPDAAESFHPYQVDAATLQLWHFDNLSVPLINAANPMHPLLGAHNGATLWTPGPAGFGLAASLNTGTAPNRGIITYGATLDATTNADAPASFIWHGADGAFTIEALVKFDSMPGTWALPGQIVSMEGDGDGTQDRVFQFRIDPSAGVPSLQFFSLASGVGGSLFLPLPTNGLHAPDTNHWFHVALTYDGNPNVAGNLKLYWSRLDATVYPANLLGSGTMVNSFTTQEGDFAIGNEGRATGGSSECFNGSIDEVRISSVARQAGDFFFRDPDSDDDGLPDVWEFAHFGNLTQSGTDDFDHDGTSNRAEYLLGLDPANASSAFRLAIQMSAGSGFTLTWPAQPSLPFSVERATSLSGPWTEIGTLTATSTTGSFTDSNPPTGGRFYRVVMIAP
jgi:autotransporter-associated beta strand protein